MPQRRRFAQAVWILVWTCLLVGCSTATVNGEWPVAHQLRAWSGRIQVVNPLANPDRVTALFELSGSSTTGSILLSTPLGSSLARVRWKPEMAELELPGAVSRYSSLTELFAANAGLYFPVEAVFAWLDGQKPVLEGWDFDVESGAHKRLQARSAHHPGLQVRIIVDQP